MIVTIAASLASVAASVDDRRPRLDLRPRRVDSRVSTRVYARVDTRVDTGIGRGVARRIGRRIRRAGVPRVHRRVDAASWPASIPASTGPP